MKYQKVTLSNGLRVLLVPMESVESVTAMILVGVGSRYESKNTSGISHFLEHMAFKGTQKRPTAIDISRLIDGIGGEFNAFTSKELTGFYIKSANTHLDLDIDVLSDMLLNSKFEEKEINKERGVILEEINLYEDTPMRKIADIYEELLYNDTPLGWDTAGRKEIIRNIRRQDFLNYLKSFYSPKKITVVIAGGFKEKEALTLIEKYLGKMMSFDPLSYEKIVEKQTVPGVLVRFKKTEQAHLCLGVRTFPYSHPDRYILSVLTAILGAGMSSRLFHEVREKRGLAYYIRSSDDHFLDTGTFVTQAGADIGRIEDAVKVILEEYKKITQKKCDEDEIIKAKEYLKGHLILELEDSKGVASLFGSQEILEEKIRTPEEIMKEIDKVGAEDIRRVAREIFINQKLNLALIGPFRNGQNLKKLLRL
ncbi:insulinase family protein [Candidatus Microgenomates bacterium]|nr:insulinase family protein [Candidatus Microgenomates bacterium]